MTLSVELKDFEASKTMRSVMGQYFKELTVPETPTKIAWCTSVGPAELLRAMGFEVYFPENHGAMLGSSRMATDLIPLANAHGFSPDICSYLTSDVGSYLKGESPLNKMKLPGPPKADVLVFNTNQCRDVKDWFEFYAREWDVPCIGVHTPRAIGDVNDTIITAIAKQIKALIPTLEEISGNQFDIDKLREVITLSRKCTELWKGVLDSAANVPSPITFFDGTIQMGPAVVLRGTQGAIDYYEILLAELKQRINDGIGAVEGEKYRIYWEGMPIWGKLKSLALQFIGLQTAVVASTYCNSWVFEALDPEKPFESMARAYSELFICRSDKPKEAYIKRMIEKYKVDGVFFHNAKTCPNNSNSRYDMPQRIQKKTGKPFVIVDGDLNDLRLYSEEQTKTNIEAFVEQLSQG
ncbi:MAG: 2-hydroxyacyl-CoA dehydratase family protein [Sedimentisphaerales bacterium]|jgi:benzoyl-CoA reductase/2-hydroxyglutaryl-CoA dehydratase subunit BcrC/BadD/HgdB